MSKIIRTVDYLGRVVIPRSIRNTLGIKEGEALEISICGDGGVKYTKIGTGNKDEEFKRSLFLDGVEIARFASDETWDFKGYFIRDISACSLKKVSYDEFMFFVSSISFIFIMLNGHQAEEYKQFVQDARKMKGEE